MTPSDAGSATSDGLAAELLQVPVRTHIVNVDTGERGEQSVVLSLALRDRILAALSPPSAPGDVENEPLSEADCLRELGLLYNYRDTDEPQFTRWNMMVAINHGRRLAQEDAALSASAAEVEALRGALLTPSGHTVDCAWHCDQHEPDCNCGLRQRRSAQTVADMIGKALAERDIEHAKVVMFSHRHLIVAALVALTALSAIAAERDALRDYITGSGKMDGNEIWEALFSIMKGDVPEELTVDVLDQLAAALTSPDGGRNEQG
jgi:hypothetical protein